MARLSEWWEWACPSGETKHVRAVRPSRSVKVSLSELWEQAYQLWKWACHSCGSEAKSKASCQLIANPDSLLPVKAHPPVPVCFQQVQIHCYQLAPSKARFTPTSLLPVKPVSPLPAKPDPPLPAESDPPLPALSAMPDCERGESEHSTATSWLTVMSCSKLLASS